MNHWIGALAGFALTSGLFQFAQLPPPRSPNHGPALFARFTIIAAAIVIGWYVGG